VICDSNLNVQDPDARCQFSYDIKEKECDVRSN
jgi:hypothetical protein